MQGFKSFASRTEIPFDPGINSIIGPNGAGKSNISDALCFVLGRLSVKSMRAAKASNLIFMGSKRFKPAKEAWVEIVFDNSDKAFQSGKSEVVMKRIVRRNGQSIYKIDGETKTRTEVLEMLAHAGIDPHGFNLILQGQIQSVVRMHPEERRKIIEEVAGISIYESRKEKSLHELEKTDEKLKEVSMTLRERTSFLRNLEKEKQQAERFRELETAVKRAKATLITKRKEEKEKELVSLEESVGKKNKQHEEMKKHSENTRAEIEKLNEEINKINQHIRSSAGVEQETLHSEISGLKANCEGLRVKKESMEQRENEIRNRSEGMKESLPELQKEIQELRVQSPLVAKKAEELKRKREILAQLESQRKQIQTRRAELNNMRERIKEKEKQIGRSGANEENVMKQIEELSKGLQYNDEKACAEAVSKLRNEVEKLKEKIIVLRNEELKEEKAISAAESVIERAVKVKGDVSSIDVCPLCQSKITEEHKEHVFSDCKKQTESGEKIMADANKRLTEIYEDKKVTDARIKEIERKLAESEFEIRKHQQVIDKKNQLRAILEETKLIQTELKNFENEQKKLEANVSDSSSLDEKYDATLLEIEEISSRTSKDVDTSLLYKERDLERIKLIIEGNVRDLKELKDNILIVSERLEQNKKTLAKKEEDEKTLNEKFKKLFEEREQLQKKMQEQSHRLLEQQQEARQIEDQITYLKIGKAKLDAEIEGVLFELQDYKEVELLSGSANAIEERLHKAQEILQSIGSINMRALEMYDEMKREYDAVQVKVDTLGKEKEEIMKIIAEIDLRKKKEFMRTFRMINELFSRNFGKISNKGEAYLEVENKEDIFAGGVNIVVKLAKGKYFDVSSLSGGEQTMVALSLLFAIQEHKPYHFYVFDEIDAALDKRNSERLAALLNQYMKSGQYIVITHNDSIIMSSNVLYGVSMHEGVSKILSLKINNEPVKENTRQSSEDTQRVEESK